MVVSAPRSLALLTVLTALLAAPGGAQGAERFVSPTGSGTACTQQQKCSLSTALFGNPTQSGDELVLDSGTYEFSECRRVTRVFTMRGIDPAHRPVIEGPASVDSSVCNAQKGFATLTLPAGTVLRDLEARAHGTIVSAIETGGAGTALERVVVRNSSSGAPLHLHGGGLVRNSVLAGGGGGAVIDGPTATYDLRNVTVSGNHALGVFPASGAAITVNLVNSIARGDGDDLQFGAGATIRAGFSNFDPADVQDAGGTLDTTTFGHNQTGTPAFLTDPVGSEPLFREQPSSPTVDAGTSDVLPAGTGASSGATDLNGQPRTVNGRPDIGAHELLPVPSAETGEATDVGPTSAILHGTFNPHGGPAGGGFQFGLQPGTPGQTRSVDIGAPGVDFVERSLLITGLEPNTTYHYRAVAGHITRGFSSGGDHTFTTLPAPTPGGPDPGTEPGPAGSAPQAGSANPQAGLPPARCRVPKLTGRSLSSAKRMLKRALCKLGRARKPKRRGGKLVVIAQSPKRGTVRAAGARVNVRLGPARSRRR